MDQFRFFHLSREKQWGHWMVKGLSHMNKRDVGRVEGESLGCLRVPRPLSATSAQTASPALKPSVSNYPSLEE
jgi:hypothetical protein